MARYIVLTLLYFLSYLVSQCLCTFCLEPSNCSSICTTTEQYVTKCGYMFLDDCQATRKVNTPCIVPCNITVCCYGYIGEDCSTHTCFNETTCDNGGTCTDVDYCSCLPGFRSPNCTDIDECRESISGCDQTCHNSAGSYMCSCDAGFILAFDDHTCHDRNECTDGTSVCDHQCHNQPGNYSCSCKDGYTLADTEGSNEEFNDQPLPDPPHQCIRSDLYQSLTQLDMCLLDKECHDTHLRSALGEMGNQTHTTQQEGTPNLAERDIKQIVKGLQRIVHFTKDGNKTYDNSLIVNEFLQVASNLLDNSLEHQWKNLDNLAEEEEYDAVALVQTVGNYSEVIMSNITQPISIADKNIALDIQPITNCVEGIRFPLDPQDSDIKNSIKVYLGCQQDMGDAYSGTIYRNTQLYNIKFDEQSNKKNDTSGENEDSENESDYKMGSNMVTFTLQSHKPHLDPPVHLTFKLYETFELEEVQCVFLDHYNGSKRWSSKGCHVTHVENDTVHCECTHLTNFAILVNPRAKLLAGPRSTLSILSMFGCSVSIIGSLVTLVVYTVFWRSLRSTRATLLMHLCAVIFLAYLLFIFAEFLTKSKVMCMSAAIGLHYLFLLMFFLMLAEGFYLANKVLLPHTVDSVTRILIPAWVTPAIIVGISVGVTKAQGYGNKNFCWLSVEAGLIWAFFGPILLIIAINIIIVGLVLRRMFGTSALQNKTERQRILTGVRSVCVMVPVTGITWLMGLFTMVEGAAIFQYLFVFFNTLQGFFILIFHCLMNEQVKSAVRRSYRKMKSTTESSSDFTSKKPATVWKKKTSTISSNVESSQNSESAGFVNRAYSNHSSSFEKSDY